MVVFTGLVRGHPIDEMTDIIHISDTRRCENRGPRLHYHLDLLQRERILSHSRAKLVPPPHWKAPLLTVLRHRLQLSKTSSGPLQTRLPLALQNPRHVALQHYEHHRVDLLLLVQLQLQQRCLSLRRNEFPKHQMRCRRTEQTLQVQRTRLQGPEATYH